MLQLPRHPQAPLQGASDRLGRCLANRAAPSVVLAGNSPAARELAVVLEGISAADRASGGRIGVVSNHRPLRRCTNSPKARISAALDKDIEAELSAAFEELTTIRKEEPQEPSGSHAAPGRKKRGKIISVHGGDVFIDVPGGRGQGFMPTTQFPEGVPAIGTEVDFEIEGYDGANGVLRLTREGAVSRADWSTVSPGMTVEALVKEINKGGLTVQVNGIRGFMPFREIDIYRIEQPETLIGQKLICLVSEVEPAERNLVLSRRALQERQREEEREKFWAAVEEGQQKTGTVRSIKPFGVFVDMGGADGMIPIGELSWTRVNDPAEVLKLGQKVDVKVMKVDREARKISLSLRQMSASPWETLRQRLHPGSRVNGKVTRIQEYGAFVELEPGIEGMIHISELGTQRVRRVRDVVQEGQVVEVQIMNIDEEQRRIALSLRAITEAAKKAEEAAAVEEQRKREAAVEEGDGEPEEPKPIRKRKFTLRGGVGSSGE